MHFNGNEIISISTKRGWRTSVSFSWASIFLKLWNVELSKLEVLGVSFDQDSANFAIISAVCLAFFSFLISWCGDKVSLGRWNADEAIMSGWGKAIRQPELNALAVRLSNHLDQFDKGGVITLAEEDYQKTGKSILKELSEIDRKESAYQYFFVFYFYFWHLAVPASFFAVALYLFTTP